MMFFSLLSMRICDSIPLIWLSFHWYRPYNYLFILVNFHLQSCHCCATSSSSTVIPWAFLRGMWLSIVILLLVSSSYCTGHGVTLHAHEVIACVQPRQGDEPQEAWQDPILPTPLVLRQPTSAVLVVLLQWGLLLGYVCYLLHPRCYWYLMSFSNFICSEYLWIFCWYILPVSVRECTTDGY